MKKLLLLILVILLTGCSKQTIDINKRIAETMNEATSFTVAETFDFKQYGKRNTEPDSLMINASNKLIVQNDVVYTDAHIVLEENLLDSETRKVYQYESYIDILRNNAYIKPSDTWYQVDMINLYLWNMGSIDPISVVNSILYDFENIYYKSESGVTGNPEDYRYVVVDLPNEVFEDLFATTFFYYLDVHYDYHVHAELKFNDLYQVESITFQLDDLLSQYRDYRVYELKSDLTSLTASYSLEFSEYEISAIPAITAPENWVYSDESRELLGIDIESLSNEEYNIKSEMKYVQEDGTYQLLVELDPTESYRYLYYELYFMNQGEAEYIYYSEYYGVKQYEELLLYFANTPNTFDEVTVMLRYIPEGSSEIIDASVEVPISVDQSNINPYLNVSTFIDEPYLIVPFVNMSQSRSTVDGSTTKINLTFYAKDISQNINAEVYFYIDEILQDSFPLKDFTMIKDSVYQENFSVHYIPDAVYLSLNYNVSGTTRRHEQMRIPFSIIGTVFDSTGYHESSNMTYQQELNTSFQDYQYVITSDHSVNGMLYLVNESGQLVGAEFVQMNTFDEFRTNLYSGASRLYFLELFDEMVEKTIIPKTA